jgi:hypothetical protein
MPVGKVSGAASHGTHEFYHTRAEITKRLIADSSSSPRNGCAASWRSFKSTCVAATVMTQGVA